MFNTGKQTLLYLALAPIVLLTSSIAFEAQANDTDIKIDISGDGISIDADNRKLSDVLIQLGDLADFTVTGADKIDVMFDGRIESDNVEELLKQLGVSSILMWDDSDSSLTLKEVILLSMSEEGSNFLPSGNSGAVSNANKGVGSQQLKSESSPNSQPDAIPASTNSATSSTASTTDSGAGSTDNRTTPGFGFSIDPNSATVNPQQ